MSTSTTNLHLTKPAASEYADIAIINANYDILDAFAGTVVVDPDYVHTENNYTTTEKQKLAGLENYTLPTASSSTKGGVKVDNESISIDQSGTISAALSGLNEVNIDAVTLSDGQILKFDATSGKWVNASGGSGHTIIDENGNSMTARAGLQFVGAKVSDDATNNKTIVDMSGGGVYIEKTLWEDVNGLQFAPNNIQTITLSESLNKYDFIYVDISSVADSGYHNQNILAVSSLYNENDGYNGVVCIGGNIDLATSFTKVDNTHLKFNGFSSANPLIVWKVVGIKVSGDYYAPVIYSTEEREIGVWEDGKPIYQKTWVFSSELTISQSSFTDTSIDSTDIENIVKVEAIHDDGTCFEGTLADPTKSNHTVLALQTSRNNNGASIKKLTLQYTKISDTAGSGTWTPQGVPAVHYSTDEQVIGTWIDGSTLYEKTITIQKSSISSGNNTINHLINNFGQLVKKEIIYNYSNGDMNTDIANPTNNDYRMEVGDVGSTDFTLFIGTSAFSLISVVYATLRYTKSS